MMRRLVLKLLRRVFVCLRRRVASGSNGWLFGTLFPCSIALGISFLGQAHFG